MTKTNTDIWHKTKTKLKIGDKINTTLTFLLVVPQGSHLCFLVNDSTTIGLFAMKFGTHIHAPLRINSN